MKFVKRIASFVRGTAKGKIVPVHDVKAHKGSRGIDPLIPNLGI